MLMSSYGAAADDPDVTLLDSFQCDAWSNFANYCDPKIQKLLHEQSAMQDPAARKKLVQELDRLLQQDVSRPVLLHNAYVLGQHPYVRGLVGAENGIYNNWRLEGVWLDK
jgi:peptide/nickel transport system substrate-binding protein